MSGGLLCWTSEPTNTRWKLELLFSVLGLKLMFAELGSLLHLPVLPSLFSVSRLSHSLDSVPAVCVISFSACFLQLQMVGICLQTLYTKTSSGRCDRWLQLPALITPSYYLSECGIRCRIINGSTNLLIKRIKNSHDSAKCWCHFSCSYKSSWLTHDECLICAGPFSSRYDDGFHA